MKVCSGTILQKKITCEVGLRRKNMNAEYIQEPERTLPVRYADYDVIVAGGGIAGIAAALAAARAGKR